MPPSAKKRFYNSPTCRLIVINLITISVFSLAFVIVINTFGRITTIFDRDVHDNMQMSIASFRFGKQLISLEMEVHNQEAGFLHDPEGTIAGRQKLLAVFDDIIEDIKITPNYFQREEEFNRLLAYREMIAARLADNIKISTVAMRLSLLNEKFMTILTAMEVDTGKIIVDQVLAGNKPTGLQQVAALIPLCREQILRAHSLIIRGVDELNSDLFSATDQNAGRPTLMDTLDLLSQTLQTMTSATSVVAVSAKKIIADEAEYRQAVLELKSLVKDKKEHHLASESQGRDLLASLDSADQQMSAVLEGATVGTVKAMTRSAKILYLIGAIVLLVNIVATILIVLLGRKMVATIAEKEAIRLDLQDKMSELESEVVRRRKAENDATTAAEHLEESVQKRTVELSAVNMELEAFVHSMSHDLRTPLRGIAGFSNAILDDYGESLDSSGRHYLERIQDASISMGRTIDQILELSRFSRGELVKEDLDLSAMVDSIVMELQRNDPGRFVQVEIGWNVKGYGSEEQVRAVLESLLDNAWKFTGKQQDAKIEFGRMIKDDEPLFYLRDNGVGFDTSYSAKMFGAFQRLHSVDEFPGAGMGLALVQRVIHRHGGKVWGEGEEGVGATFYFSLPS